MNQRAYNKLEKRFIHLSESQEFEFQNSDWADLESRLDNEKPKRRILVFSLLGVSSLIILGFVAWSMSGTSADVDFAQGDIAVERQDFTMGDEQNAKSILAPEETPSSSASSAEKKNLVEEVENSNTGESIQENDRGLALLKDVEPSIATEEIRVSGESKTKEASTLAAESSYGLFGENVSGDKPIISDDLNNESIIPGIYQQESQQLLEDDQLPVEDVTNVLEREGVTSLLDGKDVADLLESEDVTDVLEREEVTGLLDEKDVTDLLEGEDVSSLAIEFIPVKIMPLIIERDSRLEASLIDVSQESKGYRPRFLLNVNAGVEVSSTPLGELSDTDYNLGLRLGYVASSKLVLSAGVNYINECYVADGDDYDAPTGFWSATEGEAPESIQAICDMIDVSIGASYHFTDVRSNGLVAHVNLNSNFMVREEYNYQFVQSEDNWTGIFEGESQSFLSNVELGATYKLNLGRDFMIDAGPYLKILANGIGHGSVKLSSFGFRVGVSLFK